MADKDTPNRSANKVKPEGERWSSEQDVIPNSESSPDAQQRGPRAMPEHPGRRRNKPGDPTDEPMSDPVPTGEDVVDRDEDGQDTPRRYDQPVEEDTRHIGNEVEAGQKR